MELTARLAELDEIGKKDFLSDELARLVRAAPNNRPAKPAELPITTTTTTESEEYSAALQHALAADSNNELRTDSDGGGSYSRRSLIHI